MLRDLVSGRDAQFDAVLRGLVALDADAVLLIGLDWDHDLVALGALQDALAARGLGYPYRFAPQPNAGLPTGFDVDGNGRLSEARDAQGYGRFAGAGGMALLSRLPIDAAGARDFSAFLWRDLPASLMPAETDPGLAAIQRLSSTGMWEVPLTLPDGQTLRLLAYAATPPVFDGPEDRNGRRNADESRFWQALLHGSLPGLAPPQAPFVILGTPNLDPVDGEGRRDGVQLLLADPALQDAAPRQAAPHPDPGQQGDAALDTALFPAPLGGLRLDYILPSADLRLTAAGQLASDPAASPHRPVWVEIALP